MARTRRRRRIRRRLPVRLRWVAAAAALLLCALLGWEWSRLPQAAPLRTRNPPTTAIIQARAVEARLAGRRPRVRQIWVPLERIALTAVEAVLVSEDDAFFQHQGVDSKQLGVVLQEAWSQRRLTRGASTITQQLAKNLWLSTDRSLVRKLKELVLARRLEAALEKERILELYLNVVEWGEGVYGIGAAARAHFGKTASELTPGEAAILAGMLPAPRRWLPASRPPALHRRATEIIRRLERYGRLSATAAASARLEIDDAVGPRRRAVAAATALPAAPAAAASALPPAQGGAASESKVEPAAAFEQSAPPPPEPDPI